jgi:hypothetical protein
MKWLFLACSLTFACGQNAAKSDAGTQPANCAFIDASSCQNPIPSYAKDVAPVLDRACNTTCHAPGVGPWPLNDYADVFDWKDIIAGDIEQCSMPPQDAGAGNGTLTDQERATILNWVVCGGPNN